MLFEEEVYVGVEVNPSGRKFTWAALNNRKELLTYQKTPLDRLLIFCKNIPRVTIGIETPAVRCRNGKPALPGLEYAGHPNGWTLPAWQEALLAKNIQPPAGGSQPGSPYLQSPGLVEFYRQVFALEHITLTQVNGYVSLCCLLGQLPLPKASLEGKIQRQLILVEQGLNLPDPMSYFEELTRFKILHGMLPEKIILPLAYLNVILAAYTVWKEHNEAVDTLQIGNPPDAAIVIPVPALRDRY